MARVLIVGAGPRGLACARTLLDHGHAVDLIEAEARCGGATLAADGLVADSTIEDTLCELGVRGAISYRAAVSPWPAPAGRAAAKSWVDRLGRASRRWLDRGSNASHLEVEPGMSWLLPDVMISELSSDLSIRVGWEVLEASTCGKAASLLVLVPSGERRLEADAVVLALDGSVALRLVPAPGPTPEARPAALEERICCATIDFPCKEKSDDSGQAFQFDPTSFPDIASVLSLPALGLTRVRLSETAAAGGFEEPDEALSKTARAALESLSLTVSAGAVRVQRWKEDRGALPGPDSPGAIFWARPASDERGVLGALRAGQRTATEVASFLRHEP